MRNILIIILLFPILVSAQNVKPLRFNFLKLKQEILTKTNSISQKSSSNIPISLPFSDTETKEFYLYPNQIMSKTLQKKYINIITYSVVMVDDAAIIGDITLSPFGFNAHYIVEGILYSIHLKNYKNENEYQFEIGSSPELDAQKNNCHVTQEAQDIRALELAYEYKKKGINIAKNGNGSYTDPMTGEVLLRNYDLIVAATGEFTQANGGTMMTAMTEIVNTVNCINTIFRKDMGVNMTLVETCIFTDPTTDPFTPDNASSASGLGTGIGRTSQAINGISDCATLPYDIGHVFHTHDNMASTDVNDDGWSGGGLARLGVICRDFICIPSIETGPCKGGGWSGSFRNTTNSWCQLATHEFGHMFAANHTFNGTGGSCTSNIAPSSSYEIGSGTTIMSYQGICQPDQNIPASGITDNYFHAKSIEQMSEFLATTNCQSDIRTGNTPPTIESIVISTGTIEIPIGTPFVLNGKGKDIDGDLLSYTWEQLDEDGADTPTQGATLTQASTINGLTAGYDALAPLFRSYPPSATGNIRYFPNKFDYINNVNTLGTEFEVLSQVPRTMNFGLTVRDCNPKGGGTICEAIKINVIANGPLLVDSPCAGPLNAGDNINITWETNGSAAACNNIEVLLSIDGGILFTYVLASNAPYSAGSANVNIPTAVLNTTSARFMIRCMDNPDATFFAISPTDCIITSTCNAVVTKIEPDNSIQFLHADPALKLSLSNNFGGTTTMFNGTLMSTDQSSKLAFFDCTPPQCEISRNTVNYDSYEFTPDMSGNYTFTYTSNFGLVLNIYKNTYIPANCANHIASSVVRNEVNCPGTGNLTLNRSLITNLDAGTSYILVISSFSSRTPSLPDSYMVNVTGPSGASIYEGQLNPTGFGYSYVALNQGTNKISFVDAGPDLTSLSPGCYDIYGIHYDNIAPDEVNPNSFIGLSLSDVLSSGECVSFSSNSKEVCIDRNCPTVVNLPDDDGVVCHNLNNDLDDYETWYNNALAANPVNNVLSSVTPNDSIIPNGGNIFGDIYPLPSCEIDTQRASFYVYCDNGLGSSTKPVYTYTRVSSYTLFVYPPILDPITTNITACSALITPNCSLDTLIISAVTGGATISNWNASTNTYTSGFGDTAGTIKFKIENGPCDFLSYTINTPTCQAECPLVTPSNITDTICDDGLNNEIIDWQAQVASDVSVLDVLNHYNTIGPIIFSQVEMASVSNPPVSSLTNGRHSGTDYCSIEQQQTYAYVHCLGIDAQLGNADDEYILVGSHTLEVKPSTQPPSTELDSCRLNITPYCPLDNIMVASNPRPTGDAMVANFDVVTGIYTSQIGDEAGTMEFQVINEFNCTQRSFTLATPNCPLPCPTTTDNPTINNICSGDTILLTDYIIGDMGGVFETIANTGLVVGDTLFPNKFFGTIIVNYTVGDDIRCPSEMSQLIFNADKRPIISLSGNDVICSNKCISYPITFDGTPPFEVTYSIQQNSIVDQFLFSYDDYSSNITICTHDGTNEYNNDTILVSNNFGSIKIRPESINSGVCFIDIPNEISQLIELNFASIQDSLVREKICPNTSLIIGGVVFDANHLSEIITVPGRTCDTIFDVSISFFDVMPEIIKQEYCNEDTVTIGDELFYAGHESGIVILEDINGCDSTINVDLTFGKEASIILLPSQRLCPGDILTIFNNLTDSAGIFRDTILNTLGCIDTLYSVEVFSSNCNANLISMSSFACYQDSSSFIDLEVINYTQGSEFTYECKQLDGSLSKTGLFDANQTTTITRLPAGQYEITLFDLANNKIQTITAVIIDPGAPQVELMIANEISCPNEKDGSIAIVKTQGLVAPLRLEWSTGSTDSVLIDLAAGKYELTVLDANNCPSEVSSVTLIEPEVIIFTLDPSNPLCAQVNDGNIALNVVSGVNPPYQYSIDNMTDFQGMSTFMDLSAGNYEFHVQDANGCISDPMDITLTNETNIDFYFEDTTTPIGDTLKLNIEPNFTPASILWSGNNLSCSDCLYQEIIVESSQVLTLTMTDEFGCEITKAMTINAVEPFIELYIPNVISVNSDKNDNFYLMGRKNLVLQYSMDIMDRWGNKVFSKTDILVNNPKVGWDGSIDGNIEETGVYVYKIEYILHDIPVKRSGNITVIR